MSHIVIYLISLIHSNKEKSRKRDAKSLMQSRFGFLFSVGPKIVPYNLSFSHIIYGIHHLKK